MQLKLEPNKKHKKPASKRLLNAGVISAPFFYFVSVVQIFTRTGFDIRQHAISTLTLGDWGWIQSIAFIITGLLALLGAAGMRSLLRGETGGLWGPILIGLYGVGMALAGLFRPDPGLGFPEGAPEGIPTTLSPEAAIHSFAFFTAFICLIAASIILSIRFARLGEKGWQWYSVATAVIAPLLIAGGMGTGVWTGVIMGCAGLVAFGWVSALSGKLLSELA